MKKILLVLFVLLVSTVFVSCSDDDSGVADPTPSNYYFSFTFDGTPYTMESVPSGLTVPIDFPVMLLEESFGQLNVSIIAGIDTTNNVSIAYSAPCSFSDIDAGLDSIDEVIFRIENTDYFLNTFDVTFTDYRLDYVTNAAATIGWAKGTFTATVTSHTITDGEFCVKVYREFTH